MISEFLLICSKVDNFPV